MMMSFKIGLTLCFAFIGYCAMGQELELSKSTLKYDVGIGIYDSNQTMGGGGLVCIGYQRDLWKDRLRLNPNLTIGYFTARHVTDVRDQWFNSICLETIVYFDLLRLKAFSLTIGAGGVVNNTRGLLGTGGYHPSETGSEYFSDWNIGGFLGGGLRINPKNSRLAFEIMPFNFHVGPDYYMEGFSKIGIEVKL